MGEPAKKPYRVYRTVETGKLWPVPDDQFDEWAADMADAGLTFEPLEEKSQPVDFPRVPDAGAPSEPMQPKTRVTIGNVTVEPRFLDDVDEAEPTAEMVVGEPEIIKSPRARGFDAVFSPQEANPQQFDATRDARDTSPPTAPDYSLFERAARALEPLAQDFSGATASIGANVDAFNRGFNTTALSGGSDELFGALNAATGDAELEDALAEERALNEYMGNEYPIPTGVGKAAGFVPGMLVRAGSIPGRLALGILQGTSTGGLSSDSDDVQQTLEDMSKGGLIGGGMAAGAELLTLLSPLLRKLGVTLRRSSAAPGTAEDLNVLRKQRGINYMENGLDETFDELGLASSPFPQSAAGVAGRIGPPRGMPGDPGMLQGAGQQIDSAIDTAQAIGARGNWHNIETDLGQQARAVLASVPHPGRPEFRQARELLHVRNEVPGATVAGPAPPATPRQLQAKKLAFQDAGRYPEGVGVPPERLLEAEAYRAGRGAVANELDETMQAAGPVVHGEFTRGNRAYRDLAQFGEMAGEQAARVAARPKIANPLTVASSAAGATTGALLSEQLGLGPIAGGVVGAIGGGAGGVLSGMAGRKYGQDVAGLAAMGGGHLAREAGQLMQSVAGRAMPEGAINPPNVTETALSMRPEDFGAYSDVFAEAMRAPNPEGAVSALVLRLVQSDPDFRVYVLPLLRAGAVEQR